MNRQEFISRLEETLVGEVPPEVLQSNLRYYREYILGEMSNGRTEAEILEELGDPRLIAKTIIDAQEAEEESHGFYREENVGRSYETAYSGGGSAEEPEDAGRGLSSLQVKLITAAVIILIVLVIAGLLGAAVNLLLSPAFWILVLFIIFVKNSPKRRN